MFTGYCISSPNICFDNVVWAPAPAFSSLLLQICIWSIQEAMLEISPDIPERQNETHDSKTYGSNRHPYMANTDHIPRNSHMENTTCS